MPLDLAAARPSAQPRGEDAATADPSRLSSMTLLEEVEASLAAAPGLDLHCQRAVLLDRLGRTAEAQAAFLAILNEAPDHADALNALGALLHRTGYRSAARSLFAQAVATHPELPAGRVNLGNILRLAGEFSASRHEFTEALRFAPDLAQAHQGFGDLLAELGEDAAARVHWRKGYRDHALNSWIFRGEQRPLRVLMPISVANGNIAARILLDDRVFAVTTLAMEFFAGSDALPPHDLVLNAIGDADLCRTALHATEDLLARHQTAPVINHPSRVLATGRAALGVLLRDMPGVVAPRILAMPRADLLDDPGASLLCERGFSFPLLLRAPGFHTGRHFLRVETAADLAPAASSLPGGEVLVIAYLQGGWADGCARKGRVMFIDGRLYPLHWAISRDWKVHYFTSDMPDDPGHRAEEQRFLNDMLGFLGSRAVRALAAICARLGLDYGGIDFGLSAEGNLLVYEANAAMAIVPPPSHAMWDYRRPAADLALLATKDMLTRKAQPP
jgi:tetratricopeptide (TPR) repeat protein